MAKATAEQISEDQTDYDRFLAEYGFSKELLREVVENTADQIPMPPDIHWVELRDSTIEGKGLFMTRPALAGELLAPARVDRKRTPGGRFVNHSTRPNAAGHRLDIRPDGDINLYALRQIAAGEELLVDYRQMGSVNGNGVPCDEKAAMETVRARLNLRIGDPGIAPHDLDQAMAGVFMVMRYLPTQFVDWVVSGRVSKAAAALGFFRAGLYLGRPPQRRSWELPSIGETYSRCIRPDGANYAPPITPA